MQTRRLKERLKKREDGETRRCPECGMVGVQIYSFYGEETVGNPCACWGKKDREIYKIEGKRFCKGCHIIFYENEGI